MSVRVHRPVALLAAISYALATGFSDLGHTHRAQRTAHSPDLSATGEREGASHVGDSHEHPLGGPNDHDDSCAACRFVIEGSILALPIPESGLGELTDELPSTISVFCVTAVPADCLARAPPAAG
jgi:hypothetical protein